MRTDPLLPGIVIFDEHAGLIRFCTSAGPPTTTATMPNRFAPSCIVQDSTTSKIYQNESMSGSPSWGNVENSKQAITVGFSDADYICDGIADDIQINAAISYVNGLGGGTVFIKEGTYDITQTIIHRQNVCIRGEGVYTTVLKLAAGANVDVIQSHNFATYTGTGTLSNLSNGLSLFDLQVNGNAGSNTLGSGGKYYTGGPIFENVLFYNCAEDGLYTEYSSTDNLMTYDPQRHVKGVFFNVFTSTNGRDGFVHRGPHDSFFVNCDSHYSGRYGYYITASSNQSAGGTQMVSCHSWSNGSDACRVGDSHSSAATLKAVNCDFEGQYGVALNLLNTGSNKVTSCHLYYSPVGLSVQGNDNILTDILFTNCGTDIQLGAAGQAVATNLISAHCFLNNRPVSPHATLTAIDNQNVANADNTISLTGYSTGAGNVYVGTNVNQLFTSNSVFMNFNGAAGDYKIEVINTNNPTTVGMTSVTQTGTLDSGNSVAKFVWSSDNSNSGTNGVLIDSNFAHTSNVVGRSLLKMSNRNASSVLNPMFIQQEGTGDTIYLDINNSARGGRIDKVITNVSEGGSKECLNITHSTVVNNAGAITKSGNVASITSDATQTSGTVTDTGTVLSIAQNFASASGSVEKVTNAGTGTALEITNSSTGKGVTVSQGNSGFCTTSPTAKVHIAAGTATAGTAPLKLTAGTNLATPENGAIEFDGTNLFITIGGVRKTII